MRPRPIRVTTFGVVAVAVVTAAGCSVPPQVSTRQWFGAVVISPHTLAPTKLGLSQGPYTVKCSGTRDDLTADVVAPDGWTAVFSSDSSQWVLRKSKDGESLKITGQPNGVSYLDYRDYVIDSEAFADAPTSWGLDEQTMSINMYIDCHPPAGRADSGDDVTSGAPSISPLPDPTSTTDSGKGIPGGS